MHVSATLRLDQSSLGPSWACRKLPAEPVTALGTAAATGRPRQRPRPLQGRPWTSAGPSLAGDADGRRTGPPSLPRLLLGDPSSGQAAEPHSPRASPGPCGRRAGREPGRWEGGPAKPEPGFTGDGFRAFRLHWWKPGGNGRGASGAAAGGSLPDTDRSGLSTKPGPGLRVNPSRASESAPVRVAAETFLAGQYTDRPPTAGALPAVSGFAGGRGLGP